MRDMDHLDASAISDHLERLHGRQVLRQTKVDVVPIYKTASVDHVRNPQAQTKTQTQTQTELSAAFCLHDDDVCHRHYRYILIIVRGHIIELYSTFLQLWAIPYMAHIILHAANNNCYDIPIQNIGIQ